LDIKGVKRVLFRDERMRWKE